MSSSFRCDTLFQNRFFSPIVLNYRERHWNQITQVAHYRRKANWCLTDIRCASIWFFSSYSSTTERSLIWTSTKSSNWKICGFTQYCFEQTSYWFLPDRHSSLPLSACSRKHLFPIRLCMFQHGLSKKPNVMDSAATTNEEKQHQ